MDIKYSISPSELKTMTTQQIRDQILISKVFEPGQAVLTYSFDERFILGGICPLDKPIVLAPADEIRQDFLPPDPGNGDHQYWRPRYHHRRRRGLPAGLRRRSLSGLRNPGGAVCQRRSSKPRKFYVTSLLAFLKYPNCKIPRDSAQLNPCGSRRGPAPGSSRSISIRAAPF